MHVSHVRGRISAADRQSAAAAALARGTSVSQAAKEAGVSTRTVFRWKASAEFRILVRGMMATTSQDLALKAVATIRHVLDHGDDSARILAAFEVLEAARVFEDESETPCQDRAGPTGAVVVPRKNPLFLHHDVMDPRHKDKAVFHLGRKTLARCHSMKCLCASVSPRTN